MLTEDEIRITRMKPAEYAAWLQRTQDAMFARFGRPAPTRAATRAKAPARVFRTTTPPRAKAEAIPPPPSMKDAILAARVPLEERAKRTFEKQMQAARDRAPGR